MKFRKPETSWQNVFLSKTKMFVQHKQKFFQHDGHPLDPLDRLGRMRAISNLFESLEDYFGGRRVVLKLNEAQ